MNTDKVAKLYREAEVFTDANALSEAVMAYRALLVLDPTHASARKNLGSLYDCQGDYGRALDEYERAERLDPDDVDVQCKIGVVLTTLHQYALAEGRFKKLLSTDLYNPCVRENLGLVYLRQGLWPHAAAELQRVTELDETRATAYLYLGEALSRLHDVDGAYAALRKFVELGPNKPWIFYRLGNLYDRRQQPALAELVYRKAG